MKKILTGFGAYTKEKLGNVLVSHKGDRFCFHIPEQGAEYVHEHMKPNEFIRELVELVGKHVCTMQQVKDLFLSKEKQVQMEPMDNGEFDLMIRFECDYGEGAAQPVLDLLQKTNLEQTPGYGMDDYCDQARGLIRKLCDAPDAGVHFFVGATQANFTVVDALLKPWQGVLCADSGHINVHETGAVEATGHKCLAQPSLQGKINAQQVRDS